MPDQEEDVVRMSNDEKRLLPGEQPTTQEPSDAAHWIEVYTQLRTIKRALISNLRELMESKAQAAKDELERVDVRILELQADRFDRRLAFWKQRLFEMNGHGGPTDDPLRDLGE